AGSVEVEITIMELELGLASRRRRATLVLDVESKVRLAGLRWVCDKRARGRINPPAASNEPGVGIKDDQYVAKTANRIRRSRSATAIGYGERYEKHARRRRGERCSDRPG